MKKSELRQIIKEIITEITDAERERKYNDPALMKAREKAQTWDTQKTVHKYTPNIQQSPGAKTRTYKDLPMTDGEYQRLLQATAKTTPADSTFDVAHNMMYDPRVKAYVTRVARIDGVLPIERLQWDLENYVK